VATKLGAAAKLGGGPVPPLPFCPRSLTQYSFICSLIVSAQIAPVLLTSSVAHSPHAHTVVPTWAEIAPHPRDGIGIDTLVFPGGGE